MNRFTIRIFIGISLFIFATSAYAQRDFKTPEELADPNGKFVLVQGVSIYYVAEGEATNPAVIFIHGFGGSTFTWRDVLAPVAEAGFYAVALDLPPFGLSDKNPSLDYSRSGMADLVAAFMEENAIERATIVGHSMGGAVTAQLAVRHPERIEKLVFVAGGIFQLPQEESDREGGGRPGPLGLLDRIDPRSPLASAALRALINRNFFRDTLISAYYDEAMVTEEAIDGYSRLLLIEDAPAGFLAYTQAQEAHPITLADLAKVTSDIPVQIIWGIEDTWVPLQVGNIMAATLNDVQLVTYEAVGHLPMEERTEDFVADLIAFLRSEK